MTKQEAEAFVVQVCKDYRRSKPENIQFYASTAHKSSSGRYFARTSFWKVARNRLHVTLGWDGSDHAETILHEVAHHLIARTKKGKHAGHPVRFWKLHYELCKRYGVTPDHVRNVRYRAKAEVVQYEPNTKAIAELLAIK